MIGTFRALKIVIGRYPRWFAIVTLLFAVSAVVEGGGVLLLGQLLKKLVDNESGITSSPWLIAGGVLAAVLVKSAVSVSGFWAAGTATALMARDLREGVLRRIDAARWSYFVNQSGGEMVNCVVGEPNLASMVFRGGARFVSSILQFLVYFGISCWASLPATIAAAVGGTVVFFLMKKIGRWQREISARAATVRGFLASQIQTLMNGMKGLKAMGVSSRVSDRINTQTSDLYELNRNEVVAKAAGQSFTEPIFALFGMAGLLLFFLVWKEPIDRILLIGLVFQRLMAYSSSVVNGFQMINSYSAVLDKLEAKSLEVESEAEVNGKAMVDPNWDVIVLGEVSFAHGNAVIFDGYSDRIERTGLTIIKGPSGTGKTTLLDLLLGLRHPDSGTIRVGDTDLRQADLETWRNQIGYVPQDTDLLAGTLMDNVTLYSQCEEDAVIKVMGQVGLDSLIKELPEGLHSEVGERGGRFSGGQRQRIAVARALIREPMIIFMDEPTSALDAFSSRELASFLGKLKEKVGIVVVTHEEVFDPHADRVISLSRDFAVAAE